EEGLSLSRVSSEQFTQRIISRHAIARHGFLDSEVQKLDDIGNLLVPERRKGRHLLFWTSVAAHRSDEVAALVAIDHRRANQVRSAVSAGVIAVAESAGGDKFLAAPFDCLGTRIGGGEQGHGCCRRKNQVQAKAGSGHSYDSKHTTIAPSSGTDRVRAG